MKKIAIITTHPIQYQIPLFKNFKKKNIICDVFFASKHGFKSKEKDKELNVKFNWEVDKNLFSGYKFFFSKEQKKSIYNFNLNFKDLEKYLKRKDYDALLFFGWNNLLYLKAFFLAKKLNIKTILRVETNLENKLSIIKSIFKPLILKFFFKFIDYFLYIGTLNKNFYQELGVPDRKLYYSPYFVDHKFFKKVSNKKLLRKRYNLTSEKIVLFVGKFIERKRPLDFLKLADYYKNKKDIKFVMIGDGELMKDCKEFIKMKSLSNVSILGFCNQKVTRDIYNITDVLILPSEYDTWGLVINEAMSCGVSVVSSAQCGASYDLVKNKSTGFVYDNKNFKVLLRKFDMLIKNRKKIVKYKKNSKLLISKFTYSKTIDSINQILNK
tara:strand:+ start:638 stop:1783 length:1146 start_codon:yes stop_codon:yes gene_type:complete